MKKEDILNILNEEIMIVEDQAGNKITCIEICDFDDIADAILLLCGVVKSLPSDDKVYDMASNYITRNGIIDKPQLRDEVFKAYKYGCYWMRKQLK